MAKERERNAALEKRLLSIGEKFKKLQQQLGVNEESIENNNSIKREGRYWRLFGENILKK